VKRSRIAAAAVAGVAVAALSLVGVLKLAAPEARAQALAQGVAAPADPQLLARGEYVTRAADCAACHTAPGGKAFAGGLAFKLPFGTMYSTNITPDRATGIGGYSDDAFVNALHKGKRADGQNLYPSMPYASYTGMTREDALAIKAYLFSLAPVNAPARAPSFGFPFNQRWAIGLWNVLFLKDRRFQDDAKLTAQQNRGAYLSTALGHCGECHTPRNLAFALQNNRQFAGAVLQGWKAFNITLNKDAGIGAWSDAELAQYLSTGRADGRGSASGPMAEAVSHSLQYLTPQDLAAMVAYLRTVKSQAGDPATPVNPAPPLVRASTAYGPGKDEPQGGVGRRIFEGACVGCHAWNGTSAGGPYAGLAGGRALSDPKGLNVVQAVLRGVDQPIGGERLYMPGFGKAYGDAEVAAVSNYVLSRFGGVKGEVTPDLVRRQRAAQ
jgi:mono/diheme cytochrome c family protein